MISIMQMTAWNITYTIQHESATTTCQMEVSSWKCVWKFNLLSLPQMKQTHLICILVLFPLHFKNSLQLRFPPHSDCLTFFLPFLHFIMHTCNRAALKGCESLPKSCVGGPFLSELHSQAAFNINHFFLRCKCKIPRLLQTLKICSCFCKECKIWKKAFHVCMC